MINAQNIYITNLKDMYAFIFDGSKFITVNKDDVLKELINNHFDNIECLLEEYRDKLDPYTVLVLEKFIKMMMILNLWIKNIKNYIMIIQIIRCLILNCLYIIVKIKKRI